MKLVGTVSSKFVETSEDGIVDHFVKLTGVSREVDDTGALTDHSGELTVPVSEESFPKYKLGQEVSWEMKIMFTTRAERAAAGE